MCGQSLEEVLTVRKKLLIFTLIVIAITAMDQASKYAVRSMLELHENIPLVQNYFDLTYVRNPGAAFNLLAGQEETFRRIFFISTTLIALALMSVMAYRLDEKRKWLLISLAMIFGGAVGNLIDRFRWGEVIDFLLVHYKQHCWPAFNIADSAITVGMVILILEELFVERKKNVGEQRDEAAT